MDTHTHTHLRQVRVLPTAKSTNMGPKFMGGNKKWLKNGPDIMPKISEMGNYMYNKAIAGSMRFLVS